MSSPGCEGSNWTSSTASPERLTALLSFRDLNPT
jgi:hypothetical protein